MKLRQANKLDQESRNREICLGDVYKR